MCQVTVTHLAMMETDKLLGMRIDALKAQMAEFYIPRSSIES